MFTPIDKNLLIAAMESAIYHACVTANIVSLHAIETGVSSLRQRFDIDPASVSDAEVYGMVDTIERATIPKLTQISELDNTTNIADRVVSFLWKNILEKPTTFPPSAHAHLWNEISSKPTTFPPSAHTHEAQPVAVTWADVTDKPTTFPPAEHTHEALSVAWDAIDDKPTTFAPSEHTHSAQCAQVSWVGNGTIPRNILLPFEIVGGELSSTSTNARKGRLFVDGKLRSYTGTTYSAQFSITGNMLTCKASEMNSAGVSFDLLVWRA